MCIRDRIVFLGCPAEERGSGKAFMIDDGLFAGLDAALLFHPCDRSHVVSEPLASEDVDVLFTGLQAHAAADPWKGRNALDAMILLFSSVGLWRQQLRPDVRVHGIIQEGGTAANIIPDRTRAWFMLRSPDQAYYVEMRERFNALADAAALATGTSVEVTYTGGAMSMHQNTTLEARWVENAAASRKRMEWPGTPSSQIESSGWIVGQTQLTLPMSVLPEFGSGPWSTIPYAAALATQRASRVRFCFIVRAPPLKVTSAVVSVARAAPSTSPRNRVRIRS